MADLLSTVELQLGPQGRILIPATLRRQWQVQPGEVLIAHLEDERLVLEKPAQIVKRIKQRFAQAKHTPSPVDELIAERRANAQGEDQQ